MITLFPALGVMLPSAPDECRRTLRNIYRERLHGTYITRAAGLRAPPAVLA
jgi:hypothetical protein